MEPEEKKTKTKQNFWTFSVSDKFWNYAIPILVFMLLCFVAFSGGYSKPRGKASFTACVEQLKNVSSGLQQEISEQGNLSNVHSIDDVCHHVLAGHDGPETCRGEVVERINGICVPGSLKFKKINNFKYELKAVSNEKLKNEICVTESGARPTEYRKERQPATCYHD